MTSINAIAESAAQEAERYAAKPFAASGLQTAANLIRKSKGPSGWQWVAENLEARAALEDRVHHAAQLRVVAKRLRSAFAA